MLRVIDFVDEKYGCDITDNLLVEMGVERPPERAGNYEKFGTSETPQEEPQGEEQGEEQGEQAGSPGEENAGNQ
jgi:hypothetical protein